MLIFLIWFLREPFLYENYTVKLDLREKILNRCILNVHQFARGYTSEISSIDLHTVVEYLRVLPDTLQLDFKVWLCHLTESILVFEYWYKKSNHLG